MKYTLICDKQLNQLLVAGPRLCFKIRNPELNHSLGHFGGSSGGASPLQGLDLLGSARRQWAQTTTLATYGLFL